MLPSSSRSARTSSCNPLEPGRSPGGAVGSRAKFAGRKISAWWVANALNRTNSKRLLLLPMEFAPGLGALASSMAATLAESLNGRVLFLNCDPDLKVPPGGISTESLDQVASDPMFNASLPNAPCVVKASFVPAGSHSSAELSAALDQIEARMDLILCVGKPLLQGLEAAALASVCPNVVLFVEAGKTSNRQVEYALDVAKRESFSIVGSILRRRRRYIPVWIDRLFGWKRP